MPFKLRAKIFKHFVVFGLLATLNFIPFLSKAQALSTSKPQPNSAYLFVYFTGNDKSEEAIRFAISADGYHYRALNNNNPVIKSTGISATGGVRDPHILRGANGKTFYMVATDMVSANGWDSNRGMVLLKSTNLIQWTSSKINIPQAFPQFAGVNRVWAPQTIYDAKAGKYMVYFSMRAGNEPDKIYYAYANQDFTALETVPQQLFFNPSGGACIDGDIVQKDGQYHLFFKTENNGAGIKIAVSKELTSGYVLQDKYVQQTTDPVEGSGVFKLNDGTGYILMYDLYTKGRYQFTHTADLKTFKVIDGEISMNFHPRHGTVMPITTREAETLLQKWMPASDVVKTVQAQGLKPINIVLDTNTNKLYLPFLPGTNLKSVKLKFMQMPGISIKPSTAVDFTKGGVRLQVTIAGHKPVKYQLIAVKNHNPVLAGYYADPEILYAEKTHQFYIYPTSDGFTGWSGTYFKAFSSADLVNWKDEGVILDLAKNVSWAKRNAWAPCIIEKKINGAYKYFYYFCAAQKIGVAVADNPSGPFTDLGHPLIDKLLEGVSGGQQIDPDVFTDPQTGKSYLYWGNGYMAGAELNDDMVSLKPGTTTIMTPNNNFREGVYVFYRKGTYYFTWSEDDTRSENYQVHYGTATSPLGKINVPSANLVIAKNKAEGIYGTGHNSVLQIPGTDEWYLVYHRFNYPNGITMGEAAGYNREVCIDKMEFNADGSIIPVKPTHKGIMPVRVNANK
ncbi:family 43 glycosylhydrolase [Mucilaginibacter paludis]|uniref:Glycoside hydrolase family 43 n=1 Tax=Mucilaginibacter paludis DSM 18603 TaxID=714943 RepID=H1YA21_9SPHI|nr:family 43 glycosylhydrolase [Mucilaginibacter paludis]EHQ25005.1 glycoside hydrolase family 43 [Mucilaginibacter paludis DSM 18603]